eukprot:CAMPEP_0198303228 /NCGR_PEP_ID=MMETSP1449-20131203/56778_1 /TAXON_ID=420275 /ORGANISM="Attheya septentrionalis, Strain CCMP2084" /LENGTH=1679 /DNA_ID=CAMNT_0044005715 /DNA_START=146 /DNA_END=5185 /DNA_ORIENTATION=+
MRSSDANIRRLVRRIGHVLVVAWVGLCFVPADGGDPETAQTRNSAQVCYSALYAGDVDRDWEVDQREYIRVINDFSEGFFSSAITFQEMPTALRDNFFDLACICKTVAGNDPNTCCVGTNAHINVSGTAPRDRPTFGQELYLKQVCEDTFAAIQLARAASTGPTISPTPAQVTMSPTPSSAGPLEGCPVALGTDVNDKGLNSFGIMFHVRTRSSKPITVRSLNFLTDILGEEISYSLHTKRATRDAVVFGTEIELVNDLSAWTQVAKSRVFGKGINEYTSLPFFDTPVYIPGNGVIQTFYFTLFTMDLRYRLGPLVNSMATLSDDYVSILAGTGVKAYPGTVDAINYSDDRAFIGELIYNFPGLPCISEAPTPAPVSLPTRAPTRSPTIPPTRPPIIQPTNPPIAPTASPTMAPTRAPNAGTAPPTKIPTSSPSATPSVSPNNLFTGQASVNMIFNVSFNDGSGGGAIPINELRTPLDLLVNDVILGEKFRTTRKLEMRQQLRGGRHRFLLVKSDGIPDILSVTSIVCPSNLPDTTICSQVRAVAPLLLEDEDRDAIVEGMEREIDANILAGKLQEKNVEINPETQIVVLDSTFTLNSDSRGLSNGAKAGITIGSLFGALALVAGGYFVWIRRRQQGVQDYTKKPPYDGAKTHNSYKNPNTRNQRKAQNTPNARRRSDQNRVNNSQGSSIAGPQLAMSQAKFPDLDQSASESDSDSSDQFDDDDTYNDDDTYKSEEDDDRSDYSSDFSQSKKSTSSSQTSYFSQSKVSASPSQSQSSYYSRQSKESKALSRNSFSSQPTVSDSHYSQSRESAASSQSSYSTRSDASSRNSYSTQSHSINQNDSLQGSFSTTGSNALSQVGGFSQGVPSIGTSRVSDAQREEDDNLSQSSYSTQSSGFSRSEDLQGSYSTAGSNALSQVDSFSRVGPSIVPSIGNSRDSATQGEEDSYAASSQSDAEESLYSDAESSGWSTSKSEAQSESQSEAQSEVGESSQAGSSGWSSSMGESRSVSASKADSSQMISRLNSSGGGALDDVTSPNRIGEEDSEEEKEEESKKEFQEDEDDDESAFDEQSELEEDNDNIDKDISSDDESAFDEQNESEEDNDNIDKDMVSDDESTFDEQSELEEDNDKIDKEISSEEASAVMKEVEQQSEEWNSESDDDDEEENMGSYESESNGSYESESEEESMSESDFGSSASEYESASGSEYTGSQSDAESFDSTIESESLEINSTVETEYTRTGISVSSERDSLEGTKSESSKPKLDPVASPRTDLDRAIEAGDWAAVGVTAVQLATNSSESPSPGSKSRLSSTGDASTGDDEGNHAEELEDLVEQGDWEGVVLAAAKFEVASEQDSVTYSSQSDDQSASEESNSTFTDGSSAVGSSVQSSYATSAAGTEDYLDRGEARAEVEALVKLVVPEEVNNVDVMMLQFRGRENELITTLRTMQERSVTQRARAAVHKSSKRAARRDSLGSRSTATGPSLANDSQSRPNVQTPSILLENEESGFSEPSYVSSNNQDDSKTGSQLESFESGAEDSGPTRSSYSGSNDSGSNDSGSNDSGSNDSGADQSGPTRSNYSGSNESGADQSGPTRSSYSGSYESGLEEQSATTNSSYSGSYESSLEQSNASKSSYSGSGTTRSSYSESYRSGLDQSGDIYNNESASDSGYGDSTTYESDSLPKRS